mmetsp:Transcript_6297/g.10531  ORF Transcript_6297/g.10531 Transcript_6297/m.10531 type:complete len:203 (+) Transcript_6297:2476-3084(+)
MARALSHSQPQWMPKRSADTQWSPRHLTVHPAQQCVAETGSRLRALWIAHRQCRRWRCAACSGSIRERECGIEPLRPDWQTAEVPRTSRQWFSSQSSSQWLRSITPLFRQSGVAVAGLGALVFGRKEQFRALVLAQLLSATRPNSSTARSCEARQGLASTKWKDPSPTSTGRSHFPRIPPAAGSLRRAARRRGGGGWWRCRA